MKQILLSTLCVSLLIVLACGDKTTEPAVTEMRLVSPAGGETWLIGDTIEITWTSKNAGKKVNIELSRDSGTSWQAIAQEIENNGSYSWQVESPESENVVIRIVDIASSVSASHDVALQIMSLGHLDLAFYLEYVSDPYPTYQTTVWLEDENGNFLQSLFVSDWLSHGGYNSRYVCSTWSSKAEWSDGDTEEIDGITGPTPDWGVDSDYQFGLKNRGLAPGIYKCNIETHVTGDYNILYSGQLVIRDEDNTVEPSPVYIPEQHPVAGQVLKNVKMDYIFQE